MSRRARGGIPLQWEKKLENVGVFTIHPKQFIFEYLNKNNISQILALFWKEDLEKINKIDLFIFLRYWWIDSEILSARTLWFKFPRHFSEYVFDKKDCRLIIRIRQADLNGEHWKSHINLCVGQAHPDDEFALLKQFYYCHVELELPPFKCRYICKTKEPY